MEKIFTFSVIWKDVCHLYKKKSPLIDTTDIFSLSKYYLEYFFFNIPLSFSTAKGDELVGEFIQKQKILRD